MKPGRGRKKEEEGRRKRKKKQKNEEEEEEEEEDEKEVGIFLLGDVQGKPLANGLWPMEKRNR